MHKFTSPKHLLALIVYGGSAIIAGSFTSAIADPPWIFGMHDPGGEYIAEQQGKRCWILFTEKMWHDPADMSGRDYSPWANKGHGVIVRLNNGYGTEGTIPYVKHFDAFAARIHNFVAASPAAHIWQIGNECNLSGEWPSYEGPVEKITPATYVQCFLKCRNAIRSNPGHEGDQVIIQPNSPDNWESGDPYAYFDQIVAGLAGQFDGFSLHCYTPWHDPALITQSDFQAYRRYLAHIPTAYRSMPVYITETGGQFQNVNNGWVKAAYANVNQWNATAGNQQVRALCLFRWPHHNGDPDNWAIQTMPAIQQDWRESMANDYRWTGTTQPPPPPPANTPDVVVDSVAISPAAPTPGQSVTFSCVVRNIGTGPTPTGVQIGVGYSVDGAGGFWGTVPGPLAAGATVTIGTGSALWSATSGTHTVTANVDDVNRFAEANEGNNTKAISITVSTPPPAGATGDPTVLADGTLHWEGENYTGGGAAVSGVDYYDTTAGNTGGKYRTDGVDIETCGEGGYNVGWTAAGEWMRFKFTGGGTYKAAVRYAGNVNSTVHIEVDGVNVTGAIGLTSTGAYQTWATAAPATTFTVASGSHYVRFVADTVGFNVNWFEFRPAATPPPPAGQPDVVVDSVTATPAAPTAGQSVSFSAVVRNAGTAATPSGVQVGVGFKIDGAAVSSGVVTGPLAAGATTTITSQAGPWTAVAGSHTLLAFADDVNRFAESNENNNTLSVPLTVASATPPPAGSNLLANGDFEGAFLANGVATGWTPWTSGWSNPIAFARVTSPVQGGAAAQRWGRADALRVHGGVCQAFAVTAGTSYTIAASLRFQSTDPGAWLEAGYDLTGQTANGEATSVVYTKLQAGGQNAWLAYSKTVAATGGKISFFVKFGQYNQTGAGPSWAYVDGASATAGASAPPPPPPPAGQPDVVIDSLTMSPAVPAAGQTVNFTAVVRNAGTAATPTGVQVGVGFKIDGAAVTSGVVAGPLAAGATVSITSQAGPWAATSGSHTLQAIADDVNRFAESNETNNALSMSFSVAAPAPAPAPSTLPSISNPGFESGIAPWTMWVGSGSNADGIERDYTPAADGAWALAVKGVGTGGKGAYQYVASGWVPGTVYRVGVSVRNLSNAGLSYAVGVSSGNTGAAGAAYATWGVAVPGSSSWQRATVDFTYSGTGGLTIYLRAVNAGSSERAGFDKITVELPGAATTTSPPPPPPDTTTTSGFQMVVSTAGTVVSGRSFTATINPTGNWLCLYPTCGTTKGGEGYGGAVLVTANDVTIENCNFTGGVTGIAAVGVQRLTIRNCTFRSQSAWGIYTRTVTDSVIEGCHLYDSIRSCAQSPDGCESASIAMLDSHRNRLSANYLYNGGDGIYLDGNGFPSHDNLIEYNEIVACPHNGIEITFSHGNVLDSNYVHNDVNTGKATLYPVWMGGSDITIRTNNRFACIYSLQRAIADATASTSVPTIVRQ